MGLDYDYPEKEKACATKPLRVRLDGVHCGEIRKVKDGYQYYPKGQKKGGMIFNSVPDVQNSLLPMQARATKGKTPAENESPDEIVKQAKAGMRKLEGELKVAMETLERATVLLQASHDLIATQKDSKDVVNILTQNIHYDGIDCDGHSLHDDISAYLEDL